MKFKNVIEKSIKVGDIPLIVLSPKQEEKTYPTAIFYHGWSSTAEKQKFRGYVLATLGYQVIIPTSIYHGDRNAIEYTIENAGKYFWEVILKNIEESDEIIEYAINNLNADKERLAIIGHSMGGFTASGIFANNKNIKTALILNGSCNYGYSNEIFLKAFGFAKDVFPKELLEQIDKYDPMKNIEKILDRPILMLHGDSDSLVDVNVQRDFYAKVSEKYTDLSKIKYIEYPKLNHLVTTNMMEDMAIWFEDIL